MIIKCCDPCQPLVPASLGDFGPIAPAPAADTFVFDFTAQIGASGTITAAVWSCTVNPSSPVSDDNPGARILNTPVYNGTKTSALIGNMIDGVLYDLGADASIDDGRLLTDTAALQCSSLPTVAPEGVVVFDAARWTARYPEFSQGVTALTAQELFYDATMYLDNTPCSPVCDASIGGERERLLWLVTAHLAYLGGGSTPGGYGGGGGAGTPGRPASKTVGSVSITYTGLDDLPASAAWFAQTQYGLTFWAATSQYRTFRYRTPFTDPRAFPGYLWRGIAYPWP